MGPGGNLGDAESVLEKSGGWGADPGADGPGFEGNHEVPRGSDEFVDGVGSDVTL